MPSAWPCCDECGTCTRMIPPRCTCMDVSPSGCHPACKNCVQTTLGGRDVFWCMLRIENFCKRRCTPARMVS
uniref:Bowman-Birk serine protease inhibitors family domain-containing protein n=1 Tax=Aegilops tauschii subsp. strangulata TaxID=200361 RepID=A0A452XL14_AEGTS